MGKKDTVQGVSDEDVVESPDFGEESDVVENPDFGEAPSAAQPTPYSTPVATKGPIGVDARTPSKQDPLEGLVEPARADATSTNVRRDRPLQTPKQVRINAAAQEAQQTIEQTRELERFVSSPTPAFWTKEHQQPDGAPTIDRRLQAIREDWVKNGKPQFTADLIEQRRKAGTWGPQEDWSYTMEPMLTYASDKLQERFDRIRHLQEVARDRGVGDLQNWLEQTGKYLQDNEADMANKSPEDQEFFANVYKEYEQKRERFGAIAGAFENEIKEAEAMGQYLSKLYSNSIEGYFTDPRVKERQMEQMLAKMRLQNAKDEWRKGRVGAAASEYVLGPLRDEYLRFGGNLAATLARGVDAIGNAPAKAAGADVHYSPFAKLADQFSDHLGRIAAREPEEFQQPIFDDNWNLQSSALPKFVRGSMYMTLLAGSGPVGRMAGASETGTMGAMVMLSTQEDNYQEALRAGASKEDSEVIATGLGMVEAFAEMFNPGPFIDGGGKKALMKQALKAMKDGKPAADAVSDAFKYMLKQGGQEAFEEWIAGRGSEFVKIGANLAADTKFEVSPTMQQMAEELTMGAALGGIMAGGSALVHRPLFKESVAYAIRNPDKMREYINSQVPEAEREAALERLDRYVKIYRGLPDDMGEAAKQEVAASVAEKERIKEQQAGAIVDDVVAGAAGDKFKDAIAIEDEIAKAAIQRDQDMKKLGTLAQKMATATDQTTYTPEEQDLQQNYADELEQRLGGIRDSEAGAKPVGPQGPEDMGGGGGNAINEGDGQGGDAGPEREAGQGLLPTTPGMGARPDQQGKGPDADGEGPGGMPVDDQNAAQAVPSEAPAGVQAEAGSEQVGVEDFNAAHPDFEDIDPADLEGAIPHHVSIENRTDDRLIITVETDQGPINLMLGRKPKAAASKPARPKSAKKQAAEERRAERDKVLKAANNLADDELGPNGLAERYFATGGKVNTESLIRELGLRKQKGGKVDRTSELKQKIWAHTRSGPSIEKLAEMLSADSQFGEDALRNAIIETISSHSGKASMIEALRERAVKPEQSYEDYINQFAPQDAANDDYADAILDSPVTDEEDALANSVLASMSDEELEAKAKEYDDYINQLAQEDEESERGQGEGAGDARAAEQEGQSEARAQAEREWQEGFDQLSAESQAAQKARDKAVNDWNNRGQALFSEDEGSTAPGLFEGDTQDNSPEAFEKAMKPHREKADKAIAAVDTHVRGKEAFMGKRVREIESQTTVLDAAEEAERQRRKEEARKLATDRGATLTPNTKGEQPAKLTHRERKRMILNLLLDDKPFHEALLAVGYRLLNGIYVSPDVSESVISNIADAAWTVMKNAGVSYLESSGTTGHGGALSFKSGNDTYFGIDISTGLMDFLESKEKDFPGITKARINHVIFHEVAHKVWQNDLSDSERKSVESAPAESLYAQNLKSGLVKSAAGIAEENFCENLAWELSNRVLRSAEGVVQDDIAKVVRAAADRLARHGDSAAPASEPAGPAPTKPAGPKRSSLSEEDQKKKAAALEKLKAAMRKGGKLTSGGIDPEVLEAAVEYGYYLAKEKVVGFAEWVKELVGALGANPGDAVLKAAYNKVRKDAEDKEGFNTAIEVSRADVSGILAQTPDGDGKGTDDLPDGDGRTGSPRMADGQPSGAGEEDGAGRQPEGVPGEQVPGVSRQSGDPAAGSEGAEPAGSKERGDEDGARPGKRQGRKAKSDDGSGKAKAEGSGDGVKDDSAKNLQLPKDEDWHPTGEKSKARANIAAIKLLRQLETEDRNATPDEKRTLSQYTGWGGLAGIFNPEMAAMRDDFRRRYAHPDKVERYERWEKEWGELHDELNGLLTQGEWQNAIRSTQYAFFTSREVVNFMWDAVSRIGVKAGQALEPSAGVGYFMGRSPKTFDWQAVEKDSLSGRILTKLFPEAEVNVKGYEETPIAPNSLDLAIGNVPFAQTIVADESLPGLNLHNYFIVRMLDQVKPGGIAAVITSSRTLDSPASHSARKMMEERADLVAAIRLPMTAFKKSAGTDVTTDILFFRKRDGSPFQGQPFVGLAQATTHDGQNEFMDKAGKPVPFRVNEYFVRNPSMVLGKLSMEGSMYGDEGEMTVKPSGNAIEADLAEALERLPVNVAQSGSAGQRRTRPRAASANMKVGGLTMEEGVPMVKDSSGLLKEAPWAKDKAKVKQANAYIGLRDGLKDLIASEADASTSDDDVEAKRAKLNDAYEKYVKEHGNIQDLSKSRFLAQSDTEFPMVAALEHAIPGEKAGPFKRRKYTYIKGRILEHAVNRPVQRPASADVIEDAVDISLSWTGEVDVPYIASMMSVSEADAEKAMRDGRLAYKNPATGLWESPEKYLTGLVKRKLTQAKEAAKADPSYESNVEELEKVQPERVRLERISVGIGTRWIPAKAYEAFAERVLGVSLDIQYTPELGRFSMRWSGNTYGEKNRNQWGVKFSPDVMDDVAYSGHELFEDAINLKAPQVKYKKSKDSPYVIDEKATDVAKAKLDELNDAFRKFLQESPSHAAEVEDIYNEQKNIAVRPRFRAATFKHFPGAATTTIRNGKEVPLVLRDHQKNVIARMIQGSTMLAHSVGTGKTWAMQTASMEMIRLGTATKAMHAVQNATVEQYAASFRELYPNARILTPSKPNMDALERNIFMSQIAMNDWDAVVVPHSFIERLPNDAKREIAYMEQRVAELIEAKTNAAAAGASNNITKPLGKAIEKLEERIKHAQQRKKDDVLTFEQLGVDALFVDEAHEFKKFMFESQRDNIKGLDKGFSAKGENILMKVRWVQENNRGRNVIFATGTPVSNTIAELWNFVRVLRPDIVSSFGVERFDEFDTSFADVVTNFETTARGTIEKISRFAKFKNVQGLLSMWLTVADVVTADEAELERPPIKGGEPTSVVIEASHAIEQYTKHLQKAYKEWKDMSREKRKENSHIPLRINQLAKMASLDIRMVAPGMEDDPASKLNQAVAKAKEIYDATSSFNGVQMVFSDSIRGVDGKFNSHQEFKRKLIEQGIPENEIIIVGELKKGKPREEAFEGLKTGRIRFAIGTTASLGTGVNAQDLLVALHHLDAPYRPMDMEQREGRIIRQGNRVFKDFGHEPEILRYGVEGTLDSTLFKILAIKQRFIQQVLGGHVNADEVDDVAGGVNLSYDEMSAAISGDSRMLDEARLTGELRSLYAQRDAHAQSVRDAKARTEKLEGTTLPLMRENLKRDTGFVERYGKSFADVPASVVEVGGKKHEKREDAVKAIQEFLDVAKERAIDSASSTYAGKETEVPSGIIKFNGEEVAITAIVPRADEKGLFRQEGIHFRWSLIDAPRFHGGFSVAPGLYTSIARWAAELPEEPARMERGIALKERELAEAKSLASADFSLGAEIGLKEKKLADIKESLQKDAEAKAPEAEGSSIVFPSVFMRASEFQAQDSQEEEEGPDDDGGGSGGKSTSSESRMDDRGPSDSGSFWNMSDRDMRAYFRAVFGQRGGASRDSMAGPSTWRFPSYDQFDNWMQERYKERDIEGMRDAFVEQPDDWKVKFTKASRKSGDQHYKDWIAHLATGAPLPQSDPPRPRTTQRPGPDGKVPPPPTGASGGGRGAAPPPNKPAPPPRAPGGLPGFDLTAIIQFARELGTFPTVRRMLGSKRGFFDRATRDVVVRRRLSWNTDQVGKTLAHEIGHLVDLAIELESGKRFSIARKLKPLDALKKRIKDSAEIKKQAKALSAKWRGPFTADDKYRNSANELFADYFSAMLNDPEMVNQEFPLLFDTWQGLMDGKPDFKSAYEALMDVIGSKQMAGRIIDQIKEDVKRSSDVLMNQPARKRSPIWESGIRALANDKYRARQIEGERSIGKMLSEQLEYVGTWAHNQTAVFENEWKRQVVPKLQEVHKDINEARSAASAYVASMRVIQERKAAGLLFEQNPDAAREVLTMLSKLSPVLNKFEAQVQSAPANELYDLAATMISDLHMAGDKHVEHIASSLEKQLDKLGISHKGMAIMTAFDVRGKLLNPYGLTPESAADVIKELESELGKDGFAALEQAASAMRGLLYKYQNQLHKEGLISDEVYRSVILPNKDNYVPFVVIDHFDGRVAAAVMKQHGTTKGIMDVTLAIPMKVAAINSWRQTQRATRTLINVYEKAGAPYVVSQRMKKASDIHAIQSRNIDEVSRLVYYKNGSPYVAEFQGDHGQTLQHALSKDRFIEYADLIASMGNITGAMAQVYTTLSLSFMAYNNPIRGLRTALLRFGAGSTAASMRKIPRAMKAAWSYSGAMYGGKMNDDAERFVEMFMLNAPRIARAMYADSEHAKALLDGGMILASQINGNIANQKSAWWDLGGWPRAAFRTFARAMQTYEAFEKMMHYHAAKQKGLSEAKALAMGRRGGIPNPTLGGSMTGQFEVAFMWTRVHVQGMRITQEIMRDPELRSGFAARFMMYEMIPRIAMWAIGTGIAYGLLWPDDEEEKPKEGTLLRWVHDHIDPKGAYAEALRRINPHKMAMGNLVPLDFYDPRTGKYHPFSDFDSAADIPDWYEVHSFRVPSSEEGRLWGALMYNWLAAADGPGGSMDYARGGFWKNTYQWITQQLLMDVSPPIAMTGAVAAMTIGDENPDSSFGPHPLANEELFEAGGKDKAQAILGYVLKNIGGPGEYVAPLLVASGALDQRAVDPISKRVYTDQPPASELLPMGRSMFAHDNYGQYRIDQAEKAASEETRAKLMLKLPKEYRGMLQFYNRNSKDWKTLDAEGRIKYQYAKSFSEYIWGNRPKRYYDPADNSYKEVPGQDAHPLNFYAKGLLMLERGASDEAWATWMQDMGTVAAPLQAGFEGSAQLSRDSSSGE